MISMLLMQPVLSEGENSAIEAVIGAVLERINRTDGTVCHEEVIGDYATYLNRKNNITSTDPQCDYKMVDTDYLLPIAMQKYFVDTETGQQRSDAFFNTTATFLVENDGLNYETLAEITLSKIMNATAAFAAEGGQIKENLIHLREDQPVGEWRDSNNGLGGGRIPYDVNAALVPAGLRAIAALSRAGFFTAHPEWNETADQYAQVWEDSTLQFFEVNVPQSEASSLVSSYVSGANLSVPSNTDSITNSITYYGVALDGNVSPPSNASGAVVPIMNTDDCFRHFFLNTTNQVQLSAFLSQTADHILKPFPVGLASDVGLFVANPAYAGNAAFAANFSRGDYHGTVVWGWQLAMMGAGLGRQLGRCSSNSVPGTHSATERQSRHLLTNKQTFATMLICTARFFLRIIVSGTSSRPTMPSLVARSGAGITTTGSRRRRSALSPLRKVTFANSGVLRFWLLGGRTLGVVGKCTWIFT